MNILFLTYQGDMAGSTNSISYLAKGLAERGHTVVAGIRRESLLWQLLEGSKVHREPMTFRHKVDLQNMRQIRDVVRKYNIQVINAQSSIDRYTSILAKKVHKLNVKLVHTRRQTPKSMGGYLQNSFYIWGTDKIVTVSNGLKQTFVEKGFPANHIQVVHNGIPTERYNLWSPEKVHKLRQELEIAEGDIIVGCIARMKEQHQLVEALPLLPKRCKLLFAGIEQGSLDAVAQQHGVQDRIIYAGNIPGDEVMNYYKLMDVHVLPSTMDGFGLALVEAMGMEVPVVGTRYEGIVDVIGADEKYGLLFENGNIAELAQKIRLLLEDEQLRQRLVTSGKRAAYEVFSIEKTITNYENFFRNLINE